MLIPAMVFSQNTRISGVVREKKSNRVIIGAQIFINGTQLSGVSDNSGRFDIKQAPEGEQTLIVSAIGYKNDSLKVNVLKDAHSFHTII